ncbi:peptidylprolyl isomerase [bacterium]|nr:peptidylprolyl isomerase [bacterium]
MKSIAFRLVFVVLAAQLLAACSSVPDSILATMQGDTLRTDEYEKMFLRTRMDEPYNMDDKKDFLHTLVNFRLKLREAKEEKIAEREAVQKDLKTYRNQLAKTFLYEHELKLPGMHTLYDRRKEEVSLQHIVIGYEKFDDGSIDTLSTLEKAKRIFRIVRNSTAPFDSLVLEYSDDESKERTLGKLGWFIAGQSFPKLDDMVYNMQVGEITPNLLRTAFGYHILKLIGRKPSRQRLRPAHILYRLDINNPDDTTEAYAHLSLVLDSLRKGLATFEELARRNSQDSLSGAKGGDLGWMNRGTNLEPNFETALFNLQVGEVSGVVRTAFGMHIIKVLDEEPIPPFEEVEDELRTIYMRERFAMDFLNFVKSSREKYDFKVNDNVARLVMSRVDSTVNTSTPNWEKALRDEDFKAYLFSTKIGPVTVRDAIQFSKKEPTLQMRPINRPTLDTLAMMMADELIAIDQTKGYEQKYPELKRLLTEYRQSTLVSTLEDEQIWGKLDVTEDSVRAWWEPRKDQFIFPARVQFAELYTYTEKQSRLFIDSLNNGADFQELAARYTQRPGLHSAQDWPYVPVNENELSKVAATLPIGQATGPLKYQSGFSLIKLLDRQPPRTKTFEEAHSAATAGYKEYKAVQLREHWLQSLRQKYQLETYPDHLEYTFVKKEAAATE